MALAHTVLSLKVTGPRAAMAFRPGRCGSGPPQLSDEDIEAAVQALIKQARDGDGAAARELLGRVLGPPEALDLLQRVEELEQFMLPGGARL